MMKLSEGACAPSAPLPKMMPMLKHQLSIIIIESFPLM